MVITPQRKEIVPQQSLHAKPRYDNQNTCQHVQWGHNKISTPTHGTQKWIWYTNPPRMDLKDLSHDGQTPITYPFRQQWLQPTKPDQCQYRRNKPTTQAEQPRWTSQTSTSGPLIRRRVIIHVEDNTPKPANRLPTHRLFRTHTRRHYDISAASRESKTTTTKKISQSFPAYQFLYLRPSAKEYPLRKQIPRPTNSDNHSYPFFHRQRSPRNTKHKD